MSDSSIEFRPTDCAEYADRMDLTFDFTMAFQPIVNAATQQIFAHEALVRGLNNEPAGWVFKKINDRNCYHFEQSCKIKAIKLAAKLNMSSSLCINFMPNAVHRPQLCIRSAIDTARQYGFPLHRIILEITECEKVDDYEHLREIIRYYKQLGFKTALDDFGAGYSGLNLFAEIQTDIVKLDMALVRNIDRDKARQAIIKGIFQVCRDLSTMVIAEGVETYEELSILQSFGIELFQGYYFAKPAFQSLATLPSCMGTHPETWSSALSFETQHYAFSA